MSACPNCTEQMQPAIYMHDASRTLWFDFICGACGFHSESFLTREARASRYQRLDEAIDRTTGATP